VACLLLVLLLVLVLVLVLVLARLVCCHWAEPPPAPPHLLLLLLLLLLLPQNPVWVCQGVTPHPLCPAGVVSPGLVRRVTE
jgi:uncharacterized membrane protein YoaK (UPF0700 family)